MKNIFIFLILISITSQAQIQKTKEMAVGKIVLTNSSETSLTIQKQSNAVANPSAKSLTINTAAAIRKINGKSKESSALQNKIIRKEETLK